MAYLKPFSELGKNDAPIAGGKGASLGEMTQAGIPVPPGFVILAQAFEHFIAETDLVQEIEAILATVNHNEIHTVEKASESIQALILSREMPADIQTEINTSFRDLNTEYVAVRSSATAEDGTDHAWAGQLESYLNTTEADLLPKVKHCWASLFTPRAIFYRFEKGLHAHKISVAVVVQKMVASEISGIAFSVHPVTEDRNQIIIEAGFGLGEAIVSGQITPDSYVVEKSPRKILDVNVSTQTRGLYRIEGGGNEWQTIPEPKASSQVMTEAQISEFADLILKIENHYGFPCDIEWAYEAGKFYIVQSRPITTLGSIEESVEDRFINEYGLRKYEDWNEQGRWVFTPFIGSTLTYHHMISRYVEVLLPGIPLKSFFTLDHYQFQLKQDKQNIFNYTKKLYLENGLHSLTQKIDNLGNEVLERLKSALEKDEGYRRQNIVEILEAYRDLNDFWLIQSYFGDLCMDLAKEVGFVKKEQEMFGKVQGFFT